MNKLIVCLIIAIMFVSGCEESQKADLMAPMPELTTTQIANALTEWSKKVNVRLSEIENNVIYLRKIVEPEAFIEPEKAKEVVE